ncbi:MULTISPECIES: ABC transporter permease [Streptomyces]|uniref:ABC transporter permease n=1 Tax=Streptomyces TaxID=1883 RepID=UPI001E473A7A|nr:MULTISPECIES: ABC transporter permease [Streptomyces]UFQ19633.1 ABC transporter permease [Streptomyces huasconensis]WCL89252.1 ABC transporter permease [Streptomyces sp. JCM 35825]
MTAHETTGAAAHGTVVTPGPHTPAPPSGHPFGGAAAAEWTKLRSVRFPYICLAAGLIATGVFTFYYGSIARINDHPVQPVGHAAISSTVLVQFAVVVLAMLTVTGEYTTASIRSSLLWVPVRHRVQSAKALVTALVSFTAGTVSAATGTAVAWGSFSGHASFDAGETVGQALAVGVYYALIAVMTVGVSFATRHAAGALTVLLTLLWALPSMLVGLGGPALLTINDWLPHSAGDSFMRGGAGTPYGATTAVFVLLAWVLAAHVTGLLLLRRRDA